MHVLFRKDIWLFCRRLSFDWWLVGSIHTVVKKLWVTIVSIGHVCVSIRKCLSTHFRSSKDTCSWKTPRGWIGDVSKGVKGISDSFWFSSSLHTACRAIALGDDYADDAWEVFLHLSGLWRVIALREVIGFDFSTSLYEYLWMLVSLISPLIVWFWMIFPSRASSAPNSCKMAVRRRRGSR